MSTEEAELTFIRCPSCRSLVPAVASRCRMCGHNFTEAKKSSVEIAPQERKDRESSFLQEREERTVVRATEPDLPRIPKLKESIELSPIAFEEKPILAPQPTKISSFREAGEREEDVAPPITAKDDSDSEQQRKRKRRKRKKRAIPQIEIETRDEKLVDNRIESVGRMENYSPETKIDSFERIPNRNGIEKQSNPRIEKEGILIGWFVNYAANQAGISQEIRSGQFFVGRQRLRDSDLLVQDETISTPHLLVRAGDKGGIIVQDLLSEEGTYLRKVGGSEFVRCEERTQLEHGDMLRIGSYEVLVCLLPKR